MIKVICAELGIGKGAIFHSHAHTLVPNSHASVPSWKMCNTSTGMLHDHDRVKELVVTNIFH